ncbi:MAG: flagellar biosynthetic protein FliR [Deltaproteobacteria bacterium]|nr:MAG: flagellar biosynthetic protein FliR [Deltaproteobacteria bacterium]
MPTAPVMTLMIYMKEMFYGLAIGLAASLMFHAFEAAGAMVDNQRGAAQARLLIPALAAESSIFGNFNYLFGIAIFLSLGGHVVFLKAVIDSYELLPILEFPKSQPNVMLMMGEMMKMSGYVLVLALQLTAPILITIFIADVVMAVMNKAAPSIHVWELGFIMRGVLGVLMYFFASGLISEQMGKYSFQMIQQVKQVIRLLAQ